MTEREFDRYGDSYGAAVASSIGFAGQEHDFYVEAKARRLLELAERRLGDPSQIRALDVGCGVGLTDKHLGAIGRLEGVDVSQPMVDQAAKENPSVRYTVYDGNVLPFEDGRFDLAFAINVFHHVAPTSRLALARELARVTRRSGVVAIFEHNPLNPLTRFVVSRCEFDEGVQLLSTREVRELVAQAGLEPVERHYILFFPWKARFLQRLEMRLGAFPLGAQHLTAARRSD